MILLDEIFDKPVDVEGCEFPIDTLRRGDSGGDSNESPDDGPTAFIDGMVAKAQRSGTAVDTETVEFATYDQLDEIARDTEDDPQKQPAKKPWLYLELPQDVREQIASWQNVLFDDSAKIVTDLHVTLLHAVESASEWEAAQSIAEEQMPALATLGVLDVWRTEGAQAVVLLLQPDERLLDLQEQLRKRVRSQISAHGKYRPHITLAYIEDSAETFGMLGLDIAGVTGQDVFLDTVVFEHDGKELDRYKAEPPFEVSKSLGMSTLGGEIGGFLEEKAAQTDDDCEESDDEQERWIESQLTIEQQLEELY